MPSVKSASASEPSNIAKVTSRTPHVMFKIIWLHAKQSPRIGSTQPLLHVTASIPRHTKVQRGIAWATERGDEAEPQQREIDPPQTRMNNSRAACANPKQAYFLHDIGGRAIPRKTRTWPTKLKSYSPKLKPAPRIKARSYKCIVVGGPRAAGTKQAQKYKLNRKQHCRVCPPPLSTSDLVCSNNNMT